MEARRNPYVLPSNALALPSTYSDPSLSHRVLQEGSGNLRHDSLTGYSDQRKYGGASQAENWREAPYLAGHSSLHNRGHSKNDRDIDREFTHLWKEIRKAEPYVKYRNKQGKDGKLADQKWPDRMEAAFFRALIKYDPMGRRKLVEKGKTSPRGRNELIADAIKKWTGEDRSRKQVSSHIQVLKPLFKGFPKIMRYMSTEDLMYGPHSRHSSDPHSLRRRPQHPSNLAFNFNTPAHLSALPSSSGGGLPIPAPMYMLGSNDCRSEANLWEPVLYDMFVQPPAAKSNEDIIHVFSQLPRINSRSPDINLHSLEHVRQAFPRLAMMLHQDSIDCPVINVRVPLELYLSQLPKDASLTIRFNVKSNHDLDCYRSLRGKVDIYENNRHTDEASNEGPVEYAPLKPRILNVTQNGSSFWTKQLVRLTQHLRETVNANREANKDSAPRAAATSSRSVKEAEEKIDRTLRNIVAVQQISAVPQDAAKTDPPTRLVIVLWQFQLCPPGQRPEASWSRVILPDPYSNTSSKQEPDIKDEYNAVTTNPSGIATPPLTVAPQPYHPQTYDLDALSTMAIAMEGSSGIDLPGLGITSDRYNTNDIDFGAGHIDICMDGGVDLSAYRDHYGDPYAVQGLSGGGAGQGEYTYVTPQQSFSQPSISHTHHPHGVSNVVSVGVGDHQAIPQSSAGHTQLPTDPQLQHYGAGAGWSGYGNIFETDHYQGNGFAEASQVAVGRDGWTTPGHEGDPLAGFREREMMNGF